MKKTILFIMITIGLAFAGNFQRPSSTSEVQVSTDQSEEVQKEYKPETVYVDRPVYSGYVYRTVYYNPGPRHHHHRDCHKCRHHRVIYKHPPRRDDRDRR